MWRFGYMKRGETLENFMNNRHRVRVALQKVWGWTQEDVDLYYDDKSQSVVGTKVRYVTTPEELATYAVKPGPVLMHGNPPQPLDTGHMLSKTSGPGYGIFVMAPDGNLYVGQHKVGLFHHSSFLAGGAAAAAGEMKVTGGTLIQITAKSGHYEPTPTHTYQVLLQLLGAGVPLAGVKCKLWVKPPGKDLMTLVVDADQFVRNPGAPKVIEAGHGWI
jgi:hypothetical protein